MNLIAVQGSIFKEVSIVQLTKRIMSKGNIINLYGELIIFKILEKDKS